MQTSPILNPTNVTPGPAPASKQTEASAPEVPFNQVLSREVADRRNSDAQKASAREADNDARPPTGAAAPASPTDTKSASDEKSAKDDAATQENSDSPATAPADMLALVANLSQMSATRNGAGEARTADATPLAADAARALVSAKGELAGQTITPQSTENLQSAGSAAKAAPSTVESRFAALMDKAGAQQQRQIDAAAAKAQEQASGTGAAPALDLAARAQELTRAASSTAAAVELAAKPQEIPSGVSAAAMQSVQHAALNAAQAANGPASDRLTPAVGSPAWDQALGQKVVWMVAGEHQSASLTLNPPDLGPLQVVLNVSNSQANATFISAQPEVRQALEAAMPKLRDMLSDAGIQLGQATVSTGTPNQHGAHGEQQSKGSRRNELSDNRIDAPARVGRVQAAASGQGLVDTFA